MAKTYLMKEMIHEPFFINQKVHSSFNLNFPGAPKMDTSKTLYRGPVCNLQMRFMNFDARFY